MALELEAKMQVADLDAVRERLRGLGATPRGKVLETNVFFDTPDRSLLAADEGLRVRSEVALDGEAEPAMRVTFKGPRQQGMVKTREELEAGVTDAEAMCRILEGLRFERVLLFEKRREAFELDGCEVVLDELPHLGTFVEIEGDDEAAVMAVREKLGMGDEPLLTTSYVSLMADHIQETDPGRREATF